jgi:hypothetical protein
MTISRYQAYALSREALMLYQEYEHSIAPMLRNPLSNRTTNVVGVCIGVLIDDDAAEAALRLAVMGALSFDEANAVRSRDVL